MMPYFSLSDPNTLFHIENMGRDPVPQAINFFLLWGEGRKVMSDFFLLNKNE